MWNSIYSRLLLLESQRYSYLQRSSTSAGDRIRCVGARDRSRKLQPDRVPALSMTAGRNGPLSPLGDAHQCTIWIGIFAFSEDGRSSFAARRSCAVAGVSKTGGPSAHADDSLMRRIACLPAGSNCTAMGSAERTSLTGFSFSPCCGLEADRDYEL